MTFLKTDKASAKALPHLLHGGLPGESIPAGHFLNPWRRHSFSLRIFPTTLGTKTTGRGRLGLWGCTSV